MWVWMRRLALVFALAGGLVCCAVAGMVVWSIVGRAGFDAPINGDVELTQFGIALGVSLFLPWAQLRRTNIIVDFFTQRSGDRARRRLDGIGALLLASMCLLLAWRTAVGAVEAADSFETTMILALPNWWAYAMLAPGLAVTAVIALMQAAQLFADRDLPDAGFSHGGDEA